MPWHPLRMDVRCVLAVAIGLGIAALILSHVKVTDVSLPPRTKYGMVFDAGSSHTTLYIYRWPADKENNTGIVSQVEACTVPGPGISSYADDPTKAGTSLKVCLDKAMTVIPAKQQKETPTYLGATAGMRLLREQNSTKADRILAEVSKAIQEHPVDFHGARVLTGNDEGSFGWITVNYLLQMLIKAFSGYYSVFHFLNLTSGQPLSTVNTTIWDFCRKSWKELQQEFPEHNRSYLQNYCAAGIYILTILTQGYKFDNRTWQNIHFRHQVANMDVGWSLGYMLNLTNMIPAEVPSQAKAQKFVFWIITMLIVGLLLALVLWSFVALTYQRQFANYETIL